MLFSMTTRSNFMFYPKKSNFILKNRVVLAPLTRSRATQDHNPTPIMAKYYAQRAEAGLLISEGTSPSLNGVGYPRIPGIYNEKQIEGWKSVTEAVHAKGSKIFMQLMHTGRVSHPDNMPEGAKVLAPSAIAPSTTKMYVDGKGELDIPTPTEMSEADVNDVIQEYVSAAENALKAGFDGVEIHGANGYLLEQFINSGSNIRNDKFGGTIENRCRIVLEIATKTIKAIGAEKVGIRLSPNGAMNDIEPFDEQEDTFKYLANELNKLNLQYVHLVNHESLGAPALPEIIRNYYRENFGGNLILSGGYDNNSTEEALVNNLGDLVGFGRPFISNPDLITRWKKGAELAEPNFNTFYTPGPEGYIDYPTI